MDRFDKQVDKSQECWIWLGRVNSRGSGIFKVGDRVYTSKQFSYLRHFGILPQGKCLISSCDNKLCVNPQHLKLADELGPERLFWPKVLILGPEECWNWAAGTFSHGYGKFSQGIKYSLSPYAHIASYQLHNSDYDLSKFVCHRCDNKLCVNPKHLFLGTAQDNVTDMISKGRNYHKVSPEEVISIREDTRTLKLIAEEYNMSHQQVSNIKLRKSWKHIK